MYIFTTMFDSTAVLDNDILLMDLGAGEDEEIPEVPGEEGLEGDLEDDMIGDDGDGDDTSDEE